MAEIQKIGHWFFAADRVATISAPFAGGAKLYIFAFPLPYIEYNEEGSDIVDTYDLERLQKEAFLPLDMANCVSVVEWDDATLPIIVCDIPDNYALFVTDNESGDVDTLIDVPIAVSWSKR